MERFKAPTNNETSEFYDELVSGKVKRSVWGMNKRFAPNSERQLATIAKFFSPKVRPYLSPGLLVLDVGCGPGVFLEQISKFGIQAIAFDLSHSFTKLAGSRNVSNAIVVQASANSIPVASNCADVVLLVDVLHHMHDVEACLDEIARVLKPGARVIAFEPNKHNPLVWLMCLLDRNEWGVLSLGSKANFVRHFSKKFELEKIEFNGLIVGPSGRTFHLISRVLNLPILRLLLGWLNVRHFLVFRKK